MFFAVLLFVAKAIFLWNCYMCLPAFSTIEEEKRMSQKSQNIFTSHFFYGWTKSFIVSKLSVILWDDVCTGTIKVECMNSVLLSQRKYYSVTLINMNRVMKLSENYFVPLIKIYIGCEFIAEKKLSVLLKFTEIIK